MTRQELIGKLNFLVHSRLSKAAITKYINNLFGVDDIEIEWQCYDDGGLTDYNAMFSTYDNEKVKKNLRGDFDIYYLECKQPNDFGAEVYVTEIGYEFTY